MINHGEFIREVSCAKTAVLMIHGIIGTPRYFDDFICDIPEDVSIYNILLDGHGKSVSDFSRTSMKKWKRQVRDILRTLSDKYEKIIIVAHSMGTLLALNSIGVCPEKIKTLIFFACPLRIAPKPSAMACAFRVIFGKVNPDNPVHVAAQNACSIDLDMRLWKYLGWLPRYIELFILASKSRRKIGKLKIPCHAFQSGKDELVSKKAIAILNKNLSIKVKVLPASRHYYFPPAELACARESFSEIIKKYI